MDQLAPTKSEHQLQKRLQGRRVAILATDGFEESELTEPKKALVDQGAHVEVISPKAGSIQGMVHDEPGTAVAVDHVLKDVAADDFDALVLPGGVQNPDTLRTIEAAVEFVRGFVQAGKTIGAICHGPWTLIEADGVKGKTVTSWPSLRTDLRNAGALWADRDVIRDGSLITSRKPDDLPAFNAELIEAIATVANTGANTGANTDTTLSAKMGHQVGREYEIATAESVAPSAH